PATKYHDVKIRRKKEYAQAKVYNVPPEEFGIASAARSMRQCGYCYHQTPRRESDLIAEGYDPDQIRKLPTHRPWTTTEETSRDTVDESTYWMSMDNNRPTRLVLIC